ncbi:MAG: nitroreductase [Coriobacteriales bacterium]|nr:nitroreductase [Coriobacteriales bacterium]
MDALEALNTRRSTRSFTPEPVSQEQLEQILQAGRLAPSGGNSQTTKFIVIRNAEVLAELAGLVQAAFAQMEVGPDTYKSIRNSVAASKRGAYVFHYNPPVLVVVANKQGYGNAMADSSCALENMMVAANALDLGSCWINQLHWLDEEPSVRARLIELGLSPDETVCGALAIGHPATTDGLPARKPLERTGNPVIWVD